MNQYPDNPEQVAASMNGKVLNEAVPRIGIFWILDNQIIHGASESAREANEVAGFKDSPYGHYEEWSSVRHQFPQLKGLEYDEVPRGRVVYMAGPGKFRVLMPPEMVDNKIIKNRITSAFSIPYANTEFIGDEHYTLDFDNIDWD